MSQEPPPIVSNYPRASDLPTISADPFKPLPEADALHAALSMVALLSFCSWLVWVSMYRGSERDVWLASGIGWLLFSTLGATLGAGRLYLVPYVNRVGWTRSRTFMAYGCIATSVLTGGIMLFPLYVWMNRDTAAMKLAARLAPTVIGRHGSKGDSP